MHLDLVDLRLFLHVLPPGNIPADASLSPLSLPSASARIRAIDATLGVAFLQRSRRGLSPTPAALTLAP
ncbi:LysR family transcriptional regulator, partial [Pseudomonas fragi]